jgi:Arc/MetJ-type ribon-helix-helix transcriptional regulator
VRYFWLAGTLTGLKGCLNRQLGASAANNPPARTARARMRDRFVVFLRLARAIGCTSAGAEVHASPRFAFCVNEIMLKSIPVNAKRRGRPATGQDPVSAVRLPADLTREIDGWARNNEARSRSEAIRRLVELGLTVKTKAKQPAPARAARAKDLATKEIEKIIDPAAPPEERAKRRRHLTKGPLEFRDDRVDLPKSKR